MYHKIEFDGEVVGHVSVELIGIKKRLEYLKSSNFKLEGEGVESLSNLDSYLSIMELCGKHVKEVDIKFGDIAIKDFDGLGDHAACDEVVNKIITAVLHGGKVSPN